MKTLSIDLEEFDTIFIKTGESDGESLLITKCEFMRIIYFIRFLYAQRDLIISMIENKSWGGV